MDRWTPHLPAALAALLLSALLAGAAGAEDGPPRLSFEKRVYADEHQGRKVLSQRHEVRPGESAWKILSRDGALDPADRAEAMREFRRLNPSVKNPSRLVPGQEVRVPLLPPRVPPAEAGKAAPHRVAKGETLSGILAARGVAARERRRHIGAILALNPSVKDPDRIFAGSTLYLPTEEYFRAPSAAAAAAPPAPTPAAGEAPPPPGATASAGAPAVPLDRDASVGKGSEAELPARPATALAPPGKEAEAPPLGATGAKPPEGAPPAAPRPAWRGLLADVTGALGEKWLDRGTLYLPAVSGGERTVSLPDYPMVRFSTGYQAVLDFRGDLPADVRALLTDAWSTLRVVRVDREEDGGLALERFLQASGYAVVREGLSRPLLIGDGAEVRLPARWQIFRTREAFDQSDVILLKEVPERPSAELEAVLLYASRLGLRVLPYALDRAGRDGFLVGLSTKGEAPAEPPPPRRIPPAGTEALEGSLAALGIGAEGGSAAGDNAVRTFAVAGRKYAVDPGLAPAERSRLAKEGFSLFPVGRDEGARDLFLRLLRAAGGTYEPRQRFRVAGGEAEGFEVYVSGDFLAAGELAAARGHSHLVLVHGRLHPATRALLAALRVGVVEW